jgi:hypothetical protein
MALAGCVVLIGLYPAALGRLSETATTAMTQWPTLIAALRTGGGS